MKIDGPRRRLALIAAGVILVASVSFAQRRFGYRQYSYATPASFDGGFNFCRVVFRQASNGDGGDWQGDFSRADSNLMPRLSELTKTPISRGIDGEPNHLLIRLTQPELFRCPFIMMT